MLALGVFGHSEREVALEGIGNHTKTSKGIGCL